MHAFKISENNGHLSFPVTRLPKPTLVPKMKTTSHRKDPLPSLAHLSRSLFFFFYKTPAESCLGGWGQTRFGKFHNFFSPLNPSLILTKGPNLSCSIFDFMTQSCWIGVVPLGLLLLFIQRIPQCIPLQ